MRFTHCRTSIMARKQNKKKKKTKKKNNKEKKKKKKKKKTFKMRLKHCRWNMAKKLKNVDIEKHTL